VPAYGSTRHPLVHNGLGFQPRPRKVERLPLRFNSGPTPRHAIFDCVRLVESLPPDLRDFWDQL
jgi:hypothetical protein